MSSLLAGRVAGFTLVTMLPAAAGLALMVALARAVDTSEWAAVALGQSVGLMASLVGSGGWSVTGPSAVADASPEQQRALYDRSLRLRFVALLAVLPLGGAVTLLLVPDGARCLGLAVFGAMALGALSPRWFLIGTGGPRDLLRYEAAPLLVANLTAAVAIALGAPVPLYPASLALAVLGGMVACTVVIRRRLPTGPALSGIPGWRSQWVPTATEAVGGAYSTVNVALVSTQVSVTALAAYASGWRLYQWGLVVLVGVCQALQGWVAVKRIERPHRFRVALGIHAGLGVAGLLTFVALGGPLSELLFGADLRAPADVTAALGVAVLFLSLNSSLGRHVLATSGRVHALLVSTVLGAVVGVPLILVLASWHGALGGAIALAVTEAVVCAYQAVVAWPLLRTRATNSSA